MAFRWLFRLLAFHERGRDARTIGRRDACPTAMSGWAVPRLTIAAAFSNFGLL